MVLRCDLKREETERGYGSSRDEVVSRALKTFCKTLTFCRVCLLGLFRDKKEEKYISKTTRLASSVELMFEFDVTWEGDTRGDLS